MSKLVAFFEKKKKKPLKSTLPSALDEKPKEEEELPLDVGASVMLPEEEDGGSWSVEPEIGRPEEATKREGEEGQASWMKVSVVSAASVRKKEVQPLWAGSSGTGREEEEAKVEGEGSGYPTGGEGGEETETGGTATGSRKEDEEGTTRGANTSGESGGNTQEGGEKGLRGLDALINSVSSGGGDAGKKYMLPSLRARLSGNRDGSSLYRGSSAKPNFDDDQDLTTVAQLGLYRTPGVSMQEAAALKKKKLQQQQQQGENLPSGEREGNGTGAEGGNTSSGAEKKKKKKKASATADMPQEEGRRPADDELMNTSGDGATPEAGLASPNEPFNVWKYVHVGDELRNSCSAAQNNELVREKYLHRKRWGDEASHLQQQSVA